MQPESEKEITSRSGTTRVKEAMMSAIDWLVSMSNAVYRSGLRWVRDWRDSVTRRQPASISYRFLARQIAVTFAGSESTPCIVFASADSMDFMDSMDSAKLSSYTSLMIALYLHEELGSNVLLVDGSFKGGGVSDRLGFTAEAGLSECLNESGHHLKHYIKSTAIPGVFVLPVGQVSSQIRHPAGTQAVRSILDECDQFDYILIQQGSITADTRNLVFAQMADLVLLYCEEGATLVSEFEACQKIFRENDVQNVGVILLAAGG